MAALASVFAQGTLAGRPAAAAGNAAYYYFCTDTLQLFQSDGASWTQVAASVPQLQVLVDGATVPWNLNLGDAEVTIVGNRTMAAPSNLQVGTFRLRVIQGAGGSHTLSWNAVFKWAGGVAPTLTTTAAHADLITLWCDGTNLYGVASLDVQ